MNQQRGRYARGTRPSSPGNLTARVFNDNQAKAEAAKRAQEAGKPYEDGFTAGWSRGFDDGWAAGAESVLDQFRTAGLDVLGAVAQYERAVITKRLQGGRAEKARTGGFAYGSPAFGQTAQDKKLVANSSELAVVARIREMDEKGDSIRAICAALNAEGIPSKRGGQWHPQTVTRVLSRA